MALARLAWAAGVLVMSYANDDFVQPDGQLDSVGQIAGRGRLAVYIDGSKSGQLAKMQALRLAREQANDGGQIDPGQSQIAPGHGPDQEAGIRHFVGRGTAVPMRTSRRTLGIEPGADPESGDPGEAGRDKDIKTTRETGGSFHPRRQKRQQTGLKRFRWVLGRPRFRGGVGWGRLPRPRYLAPLGYPRPPRWGSDMGGPLVLGLAIAHPRLS